MKRNNFHLDDMTINRIIDQALMEDMRFGDITTDAIVGMKDKASAQWVAKQEGVICGLQIAEKVFRKLDDEIKWRSLVVDGDWVDEGAIIAQFSGSCRAVLSAERVALNFVQRMSGIATETSRMVRKLEGLHTELLDTRKTVPGLRLLDKYAVATGGGKNHRMGLYDMAMIKDNHIAAAGSINKAVYLVRRKNPDIRVEVETTSLEQVQEALDSGADMIMLDNMDIEQMSKAIKMIEGSVQTEASGNITGENIRDVASTGVDFISSGALTHSVKAFDISQTIVNVNNKKE